MLEELLEFRDETIEYRGSYNFNAVYLGFFKRLPCIKVLGKLEYQKVIQWVSEKYSEKITKAFNSTWVESGDQVPHVITQVFMLQGDIMIGVDRETTRIFYPPLLVKEATELESELMRFPKRHDGEAVIHLVSTGHSGLELSRVKVSRPKVNLSLHYNADLLTLHRGLVQMLRSKRECGLYLFHGEPGTGKSTYIRHLMHQVKKKVVFFSPQMAGNFDSPSLTNLLVENANSIFVIEDAEELLVSRDRNPSSGIAMLLNLSDGILGDSLGINIIATFNTSLGQIDKALLRKGRLRFRYEFKPLAVEKSRVLMSKLGKLDRVVDAPMTLADIYHADEEDYRLQDQRPRIGFLAG
jgi:hypothetical protein